MNTYTYYVGYYKDYGFFLGKRMGTHWLFLLKDGSWNANANLDHTMSGWWKDDFKMVELFRSVEHSKYRKTKLHFYTQVDW